MRKLQAKCVAFCVGWGLNMTSNRELAQSGEYRTQRVLNHVDMEETLHCCWLQ